MKVELSASTIEVMKNFASINSNLLIVPGNVLSTIAESKNIFANADVPETFPVKFGIYDLNNFLAIISSFEAPILTFSEEKSAIDGAAKFVTITDKNGGGKFQYFGSPEKVLTFISKQFVMPPVVAEFDVTKVDLLKSLKAAQMAQLPNFIIEGNAKAIDLVVRNFAEDASNEYRIEVSKNPSQQNFAMVFQTENIRLLTGAYQVALDGKLVTRFANKEKKVTYFIAVEKVSTYGNK